MVGCMRMLLSLGCQTFCSQVFHDTNSRNKNLSSVRLVESIHQLKFQFVFLYKNLCYYNCNTNLCVTII